MAQDITFISPRLNLSGVSKTAQEVANYLDGMGWKVSYISADVQTDAVSHLNGDISVQYLDIPPAKGFGKILYAFKLLGKFISILKSGEHKKILIWGKEYAVMFAFLRGIFGGEVALVGVNANNIDGHIARSSKPIYWIKKNIYKILIKHIDYWIAQSGGIADEMILNFGVKGAQVKPICPAIEKSYFDAMLSYERQKEIVFVGRLEDQKNPMAIIEYCADFLKANAEYKLRIIGDGFLRSDMEARVVDLDLNNQVFFEGFQKNPKPYLEKAKLMVLTSRYEGFGMVIVEAMAMGVPVVSLDVPSGPREIIEHDVNGYLARDKDEFEACLKRALDKKWNADDVRQSVAKFHPDTVLPQYEKFLDKI